MSSVKPFQIAVSDQKINRLKQKLALADFPDEVVDAAPWERGPPLEDIKRLAKYWQEEFNWREAEAQLNEVPQYMTKIEVDGFDTYDVHFAHQPSTVKNAIPLVFVHGWPGSFIEVIKILPALVQGGNDYPAFHVVAPSLIDFGFSAPSKKQNFSIDQHAETCHKLMLRLGYNEYVVQGGDFGYFIGRFMAMLYPDHCRATHVNMPLPAEPTEKDHPELYKQVQSTPLTPREQAGLARSKWFQETGFGYYRVQSTKPQTIGYSMTDSPVGLLAWIYEKLHDWTDSYPWTPVEILTWVSVYYFSTPGPAATQRIYYEYEHRKPAPSFLAAQKYIDVPLGIAHFPKELAIMPKLWHQTLGPVVHESEWEQGGHFAAWERPQDLVKDLRDMFGRGGGAFGCVRGRGGYEE
jgi:pimeloyl-ACP methyl ester carboxylesterase